MKKILICIILVIISINFIACGKPKDSLVIYTSVDRNYSETIFEDFEKATGIKVLPAYDVEATKTTGLVNRLIAEKENPKADVFWNGEISQTLKLKEEGIFSPYLSKEGEGLPLNFIDKDNYWTAFGGRSRVFIVNTNLLKKEEYPKSIFDYATFPDASSIAIAKPLFGTTATQVAALYAKLGKDKVYELFSKIESSKVNIVDGNGAVRDLVASGKLKYGLTDTDDALSAMEKGLPVDIVFPDQGKEMIGTLVIPNSVGIIKNSPNRKNAELFVDYLLKKETMKKFIESGWCQVTTLDIEVKSKINTKDIKIMDVSFEEIFKMLEPSSKDMTNLFIK